MAEPPAPGLPGDLNPLEHDDQILDQDQAPSRASQKVALDLDDAPFLRESPPVEKKKPPPDQASLSTSTAAPDFDETKEDASPPRKTIFILGAAVLLLLAGGLVFWLIRPVSPPEPVPPPDLFEQVPPPPAEPTATERFVDLEPFWIAYAHSDEVLFLSLKMSLVTEDPMLSMEIQRKAIILRDATYYYLNNRPLPSVKRAEAAEVLKQDLLSVLNQHLSRPLTGVLIEEYLVQ